MIHRVRKGSERRRGNAMIEFALASSLLIPVFLGTFQVGYTFYAYNLISTQIKAGSRYASMKAFKCVDAASISNYKQKVRNVVRFGNPSGTGTVIEPGLTDAQITVNIKSSTGVDADATHTPAYVDVSANGYSVNALFTTYTFTGKPYVRFPYLGSYQATLAEAAP